MVGLPGDDRQKIIETTNLAKRINPDFAMFAVTTHRILEPTYRLLRIELMVNDWSQFTLAKPVRTHKPFDRDIGRSLINACVDLYARLVS